MKGPAEPAEPAEPAKPAEAGAAAVMAWARATFVRGGDDAAQAARAAAAARDAAAAPEGAVEAAAWARVEAALNAAVRDAGGGGVVALDTLERLARYCEEAGDLQHALALLTLPVALDQSLWQHADLSEANTVMVLMSSVQPLYVEARESVAAALFGPRTHDWCFALSRTRWYYASTTATICILIVSATFLMNYPAANSAMIATVKCLFALSAFGATAFLCMGSWAIFNTGIAQRVLGTFEAWFIMTNMMVVAIGGAVLFQSAASATAWFCAVLVMVPGTTFGDSYPHRKNAFAAYLLSVIMLGCMLFGLALDWFELKPDMRVWIFGGGVNVKGRVVFSLLHTIVIDLRFVVTSLLRPEKMVILPGAMIVRLKPLAADLIMRALTEVGEGSMKSASVRPAFGEPGGAASASRTTTPNPRSGAVASGATASGATASGATASDSTANGTTASGATANGVTVRAHRRSQVAPLHSATEQDKDVLSPPPPPQKQQQQQQQQQHCFSELRRPSQLYFNMDGTLTPVALFTKALVLACNESIVRARAAAGLTGRARFGEEHDDDLGGPVSAKSEQVPAHMPTVDDPRPGAAKVSEPERELEPGNAASEESREEAAATAAARSVLAHITRLRSASAEVKAAEGSRASSTALVREQALREHALREQALRLIARDSADERGKHVLMPVMQPYVFDYSESVIGALVGARANDFALRVVRTPAYKVSLSVFGLGAPALTLLTLARVAPHWLAFAILSLLGSANIWQVLLLNTKILRILGTNFTALFVFFNATLAAVSGLFVWSDVEDTRLWAASLVISVPYLLFDAVPLSARGRRRLGAASVVYLLYVKLVLALVWFGYFRTEDRQLQVSFMGDRKINTLGTFLSCQFTLCIISARAVYRGFILGAEDLIVVQGIKKVAMPSAAARELIALSNAALFEAGQQERQQGRRSTTLF